MRLSDPRADLSFVLVCPMRFGCSLLLCSAQWLSLSSEIQPIIEADSDPDPQCHSHPNRALTPRLQVRKWLEDRRIPYKIAMDSGSFFVPRNF